MHETISILHVDDEPAFTDLVKEFLGRETEKFVIESSQGADEGLNRLAQNGLDCVISDYDMPGKNGIDFLKSVRSKWSELPFILYTGKGSEEIASDAISAGATDYIQKKSGKDHYTLLSNRIQNAVEKYRAKTTVQRTDERYHNLVDTAPIPILLFDEDGKSVYANEAAVTFLNTESYADLDNEPFTHFLHPDDHETATERFQTFMSEEGDIPGTEYQVRTVDGEIKRAKASTAHGYYRGEKVAQVMIHD